MLNLVVGNEYTIQFSKEVLWFRSGDFIFEVVSVAPEYVTFKNGNRTFSVKPDVIEAWSLEAPTKTEGEEINEEEIEEGWKRL